jgi:uncharacterized protein
MRNRLAGSTSPYLLQHADNPVEWWPWEAAALAEAERRGVPILLSVGYAACHWCHVMAHESFEDPEVARLMNDNFVCIKVDREERPDVDAVYMEATQAMTGRGGWPMTCFLTPRGEPFFCGTYFPPRPGLGVPSFPQVLVSVSRAWRERRGEIEAAGADVVRRLSELQPPSGGAGMDAVTLDAAATALRREYDERHGGFAGAPKFPPSMCLEFLLRQQARTGDETSLRMVEHTCERMARGGMYDQLEGGFARYSVDAAWVVPHFEKMLYDNALLLRVYTHLWRQTGSPLAARVALETAEFMQAGLGTDAGGFASSLDADTEGVEGLTYSWSPRQLADVLGPEEGTWAAELLVVTEAGTFEHGASTLQLPQDPEDGARWQRVRDRLRQARATRPQPGRDDKVVAAWNGLALAGLADAGTLLDRADLVAAAQRCADLLLDVHLIEGRLRRTSRDGRPGQHAGVLEDYADVAEGLLALYAATGATSRLQVAGRLLEVVLDRFADGEGGFYDTADDAEDLVRRPRDLTDSATPSGLSAAAGALLTYAAYTGSRRHREAAESALQRAAVLLPDHARFAGWAAAVGEALLAGPVEVAVVGPADDPRRARLVEVARMSPSPGLALAMGPADGVPLLAGRPLVDGRPAAYVCRQFACRRPVTSVEELQAELSVRPG